MQGVGIQKNEFLLGQQKQYHCPGSDFLWELLNAVSSGAFEIQSCRKRISLMVLLQVVGAYSLPPMARSLKLNSQVFPPPFVWLCILLVLPGFTQVCGSVN